MSALIVTTGFLRSDEDRGCREGGGAVEIIGSRLGGCRIEELIGSGGMGSVYRAHHLALDKKVAIKILAPFLAGDEDYVGRFVREARAAAKLEHPNIVQVLNVGREGDRYFIILHYVDGESLHQVLRREKRLSPERAGRIVRDIATGLAVAHRGRIVHRDIKPSNILIGRDGVARIADFGLARHVKKTTDHTVRGTFMGTPDYASPEQVMGKEVGELSDLYSLGVTWYRMLSGTVPFHGKNAVELATKHAQEEPPPLASKVSGVPPEVVTLVHRLLQKDPARRGAGASALVTELDELGIDSGRTEIADMPTESGRRKPTSIVGRLPRRPLRHAVAWIMFMTGLGLLFLVGAMGGGSRRGTPCGIG